VNGIALGATMVRHEATAAAKPVAESTEPAPTAAI